MSEHLLSDEHKAIRDLARDFGVQEIRPRIHELEKAKQFPREMYRQMGEMGFFGCMFPEEMGGTGSGFLALAIIAEQIAWAYPPLSAGFNLQAMTVPLTIYNWGDQSLVDKYVPGLISGELLGFNAMTEPNGGSDFLGAMHSRAVKDGDEYVLNGSKMFITHAVMADVGVAYAKTDPGAAHKGVSAFVVEAKTPGFHPERVPCSVLGSLMPTCAITFEDCRVPCTNMLGQEGEGFRVAMNAMDFGRLSVAARSLGLAQACLDASLDYCNQREAFGQKIGHFQMIKRQLADMVVEVAAARHLVYHAAWLYDQGTIPTRESTIAKYYASEVAQRAAQSAAEIFGGYAFTDEYPIAIYMNYAKLWQTGEGSANIQRILLADDALGWKSMDRHKSSSRLRVRS